MGTIANSRVVTATLVDEAVSASTAYVLVDLSDTTNYCHDGSNVLYVQRIRVSAEKASDGAYDLWFGTVVENDSTDGTAHWFHCLHLEMAENPTDSTDRFVGEIEMATPTRPEGLCLAIDTASGKPFYFLSNATQANSSNWQNDTGLASPAGAAGGATGKPGVGDLVMWCEETGGSGTIDLCVSVDYTSL